MWDTLNYIINKKKINKLVAFHHNGNDLTDAESIAKQFNYHFKNAPRHIYKSIPAPSKDPCSFVNNISNTLYFNPVSEDEIISIISKFKNKSAGYEEIEAKVVKYVK